VDLRVIGCHGGETPKHRTSAFLLGETLAIDAGALTSGLEIAEQAKLELVLVSHAHLDHVRDLATLADNRCQMQAPTLKLAGTPATLEALKKHFFNNLLWPDFSTIPAGNGPTLEYVELPTEGEATVCDFEVRTIPVAHTIDSSAFVVRKGGGAVAYSGDTGPTDKLWKALDEETMLRAILMEVSFPNREEGLARASGHHTPATLAADLAKLEKPDRLPTLLYHIKPFFQTEVEKECARLKGLSLEVLALGDHLAF